MLTRRIFVAAALALALAYPALVAAQTAVTVNTRAAACPDMWVQVGQPVTQPGSVSYTLALPVELQLPRAEVIGRGEHRLSVTEAQALDALGTPEAVAAAVAAGTLTAITKTAVTRRVCRWNP